MTRLPGMLELIERKKRGFECGADELAWLCREYARGAIPDYQLAAWLMAVRWRGMTARETRWLTDALVASGRTLEWPGDRPVVDKHSTGGVGDKVSIVLVPLLAAAGLTFVKMSGRGLGHTGGTLDKLESIPGFQVELPIDSLRVQVARIGCALVGQSPDLAPADGALYALRDVTGTVDSVPLIASSVMSKKLAAGARAIVLDVKWGSGAFMADRPAAEELARLMVGIGEASGRRVRAVVSPMDEPLGVAVGNALEVREAIEVLRGGGPGDLRRLVLVLGAELMELAGVVSTPDQALRPLAELLDGGAAVDRFEALVAAQGGDAAVVSDPDRLPKAPHVVVLSSEVDGWIERVEARPVAGAALALGAGRRRKGDRIDPRTGVRVLVKRGDRVAKGQPVAEVHAGSEAAAAEAFATVRQAIHFATEPTAATVDEPIVVTA